MCLAQVKTTLFIGICYMIAFVVLCNILTSFILNCAKDVLKKRRYEQIYVHAYSAHPQYTAPVQSRTIQHSTPSTPIPAHSVSVSELPLSTTPTQNGFLSAADASPRLLNEEWDDDERLQQQQQQRQRQRQIREHLREHIQQQRSYQQPGANKQEEAADAS